MVVPSAAVASGNVIVHPCFFPVILINFGIPLLVPYTKDFERITQF